MARRVLTGRGIIAVAVAAMVASVVPLTSAPAAAQAAPNPDLVAACGVDITLIIDRSNSISSTEAQEIRDAARALIRGLSGTGARVQVIPFATRATALVRTAPGVYTTSPNIADLRYYEASELTDLPTFLAPGDSEGGTNWDDALEFARRAENVSPLTVFLTDGDPTFYNSTAPDGHGGTIGGAGSSTGSTDLARAVQEAGYLRSGDHPAGPRSSTHLFGVGVGLTSAASEDRLEAVTGPDELTLTASGEVLVNGVPGPFATADYTIVPDFEALEFAFVRFVWALCSQSFTMQSVLQQADGTSVPATDTTPITFTLTVGPSAPLQWVSPSALSVPSASLTTGPAGSALFQWSPAPPSPVSEMTITAAGLPAGYTFNGVRCTTDDPRDADPPSVALDTAGPNQTGSTRGAATWIMPGGVEIHRTGSCEVFFRQLHGNAVSTQRIVLTATAASPRGGGSITATAVVELDDPTDTPRIIAWRTE